MSKKADTIRLAVIGAGYISTHYHCPALARLAQGNPRYELAAVCDTAHSRASEAAGRFGFANHYMDVDSLLKKEKIDAAWILVDPGNISQVATAFIRRSIPCLIEKPPGKDVAQVRRLAENLSQCGVPCLVALNRRFMPLAVRAKEIIDSFPAPAQLIETQMLRHNRIEPEFAYSTAVHAVDLMRYLIGDVREIRVEKLLLNGNRGNSYLVDMEFTSGTRGRLTIMPEAGLNAERYTVHASGRSLIFHAPLEWTVDFPGRISCFSGRREHYTVDDSILPPAVNEPVEVTGFLAESAHFLECLETGAVPSPSVEECLQSLEIAEAIRNGQSGSFV
ncbi:MAG: Gfo/Idh/MocA family oxidoreductase [Gemmatimonadota bacterium]|nr:Gfo/Idh/MocA family oxidoreductase [Gemmatimonadota bacterium]